MLDQFYDKHFGLKLVVKQKTQATNLERNCHYVPRVIKYSTNPPAEQQSLTKKNQNKVYKWRIQVFLVFFLFFFLGIGSRKNHSINWRKWLALHDAPGAVETNASWSIRNFIIRHSGKPLTCSRQITLSEEVGQKLFQLKSCEAGPVVRAFN